MYIKWEHLCLILQLQPSGPEELAGAYSYLKLSYDTLASWKVGSGTSDAAQPTFQVLWSTINGISVASQERELQLAERPPGSCTPKTPHDVLVKKPQLFSGSLFFLLRYPF